MRCNILILLSVLTNTIPRWVPGISGSTFCKSQALSFLLMALAATQKRNQYTVIIWQWVVGLAINNFYDETWGDPLNCGQLEVIISILVTGWTIIRLIRCQQNKILQEYY